MKIKLAVSTFLLGQLFICSCKKQNVVGAVHISQVKDYSLLIENLNASAIIENFSPTTNSKSLGADNFSTIKSSLHNLMVKLSVFRVNKATNTEFPNATESYGSDLTSKISSSGASTSKAVVYKNSEIRGLERSGTMDLLYD